MIGIYVLNIFFFFHFISHDEKFTLLRQIKYEVEGCKLR